MILRPRSRDELAAQLASSTASGARISKVDLNLVAALVEHHPEDMTASVEAGMTLGEFRKRIQRHGQWLPIDPPHEESLTIADLLAFDLSGPRRLGYGTIRDYLIGIKVAMADGQIIKAGGKVVKNVAGYDLCKLFVGAQHSLGIIVEATFKLRPLPEADIFLEAQVDSLESLQSLRKQLRASPAEPVALDAHNFSEKIALVVAFAGNREDVEVQQGIARTFGCVPIDSPSYQQSFWARGSCQKISVLPSETIGRLAAIQPDQFLARLGTGIIYYRGGTPPPEQPLPLILMDRLKRAYDPKEILPRYSV